MIQAAILALALAGGPTFTVKGKVTVHKPDGSESPDASDVVVWVADVDQPVKGVKAQIKQHDKQFDPRVLAVAQGTEVKFPNDDSIDHNVFSNSPNAIFDLGREGKNDGKTWTFSQPAMVDIYCNVHPEMIAYLLVTPSKLFAVTHKDGSFEIKDVPAGKHKLTVWERFMRPKFKNVDVEVTEGLAPLAITVDERVSADDPHKDKKGTNYKPGYH